MEASPYKEKLHPPPTHPFQKKKKPKQKWRLARKSFFLIFVIIGSDAYVLTNIYIFSL